MRIAFFTNGNEDDTRMVRIEVDSRSVSFYFDNNKDDFYWLVSDDWITHSQGDLDAPQNWIYHMREKRWFTEKMKEFIDKCLKVTNQ